MKSFTTKTVSFGFVLLTFACGQSDNNKKSTVEEAPPNVCKALTVMGTFPKLQADGKTYANEQTYGIACFEGYVMRLDRKSYPANLKCKEAEAASEQGDLMAKKSYEPLDSQICPTDNVMAVCNMATSKTLVYKGSEDFFKQDAFTAYCDENGGKAEFISL